MRILYVTLENLSLHKGSVVHIKEVITGLRKLGHQVGLIAYSWNNSEEVDSFYNLHRFSGIKKQPYIISSVFLFIYLFKVLHRYDVIYARDYHTVIVALLPRIIFKKKLIFEINGLANEEQKLKMDSVLNQALCFLIRWAERMATKHSDKIVSVTHQIASYLMAYFDCPTDKVEVISNGVNTKAFRPMLDQDSLSCWREKLGITKEEVVIIFVGNLAPWQGVEILVESGFKLSANIKNLKFLIIGDGFLKRKLIEKVTRSRFKKNYIFTGMVDYKEVPLFINAADICVAPFISKRNQKTGVSPLKIFEYMACGKPVIASKVEGLEFIEREGVGKLTEPGDVKGIEEALVDLIRNHKKRMRMGGKGLQIAREKYNWDLKVVEIEKLLKELV